MAPFASWTISNNALCQSSSSCACGSSTTSRSSSLSPRVGVGVPTRRLRPRRWAAVAATAVPVAHDELITPVKQGRQPGTSRPRQQPAIPVASPLPQQTQQPPLPQQTQLLESRASGGPRLDAATSRPRAAHPRSGAPDAFNTKRIAPTIESAKVLAPISGRQGPQQQPTHDLRLYPPSGAASQQQQQQQQGRVSLGAAASLSPRHSGFALRTGLALTWLGTNSGAPTLERNVSCTLVRLPGAVQMVDCGEGTHRQLMALEGSLDLAEIDGIFITHLHGDHCFGVPAALALLDGAKAAGQADPARQRHHVYGPPGLAELIRVSMIATGLTRRLQLPLLVTELVCAPAAAHPPQPLEQALGQRQRRRQSLLYGTGRGAEDGVEPGADRGGDEGAQRVLVQRVAARRVQDATELTAAVQAVQPRVASLQEIWSPPRFPAPGQYGHYGRGGAPYTDSMELSSSVDEDLDEAGSSGEGDGGGGGGPLRRPPFVAAEGLFWELPGCAGVRVRAAQLQHRVPCWGYVFTEAQPYEEGMRRRKVVVLGDTVCSRPIAPLAAGCDVLSHEATFARGMEAKARIAQHSTGWMAGAFAEAVGARSLVLTHFSARYREGPREMDLGRSSRAAGHQEAEQQSWAVAGLLREAASTYSRGGHLFAATDFYTHHVPPRLIQAAAAP